MRTSGDDSEEPCAEPEHGAAQAIRIRPGLMLLDACAPDDLIRLAVGYSPMPGEREELPPKTTLNFIQPLVMKGACWYLNKVGGKPIDPQFLDDFTKDAITMYPWIRQVSSNVRDCEEMEGALKDAVSAELVAVLSDNLQHMSDAARARGVEVHDVTGGVVGVHFGPGPGVQANGYLCSIAQGAGGEGGKEEEWVQVHVAFSALESGTLSSGGSVVQRSPPEVTRSIWVFEGKVRAPGGGAEGGEGLVESGSWRLVAVKE